MTNANPKVQYPGLRGSEQHHDLKDASRNRADPGHGDDGEKPSDALKKAKTTSDGGTKPGAAKGDSDPEDST